MTGPIPQWCLVVPVKRLATAKSRLARLAGAQREELALAFCLDTVEGALSSPHVLEVLVVTDDAAAATALRRLGAVVVGDEPAAGLNPALRHGARIARDRHPGHGIGALSADLPALRPAELTGLLDKAMAHRSSVVRDADGAGSTVLLTRDAALFAPRFGPSSGDRHVADGAQDLSAYDVPSLRRDVDTEHDLREAMTLGLGPRSAAVVRRLGPQYAAAAHARR